MNRAQASYQKGLDIIADCEASCAVIEGRLSKSSHPRNKALFDGGILSDDIFDWIKKSGAVDAQSKDDGGAE
ncbi:MAG: hypothetical protein ACYTEQ_00935 [Planctomycetota bacterium]|jgi:hypothetical protein